MGKDETISALVLLVRDFWSNYDHDESCWLYDSPDDFDPTSVTCRCCKAGTLLHQVTTAQYGAIRGRPRTRSEER